MIKYNAQGLLVERCRFLEQSGCASVCINTCKAPYILLYYIILYYIIL